MSKDAPVEQEKILKNNLVTKIFRFFIFFHFSVHKIKLRYLLYVGTPSPFNNVAYGLLLATCLNPSSRLFRAAVELVFLKDNFTAFSKYILKANFCC